MKPFLLLAIGTLLCSCSTAGFKRAYERTASTPTQGIEGAWDGVWRSNMNGHHGKLQCVVSPTPSPNDYQFYFAGTYGKLFRFAYKQRSHVVRHDRTYRMSGNRGLGWFGNFSYQGTVVGDTFNSTYKGGRDHGVFQMTRAGK